MTFTLSTNRRYVEWMQSGNAVVSFNYHIIFSLRARSKHGIVYVQLTLLRFARNSSYSPFTYNVNSHVANSENPTEVESDDKINMVVCYFSILFTFVRIIKSHFLSREACETLKINEEHNFLG